MVFAMPVILLLEGSYVESYRYLGTEAYFSQSDLFYPCEAIFPPDGSFPFA